METKDFDSISEDELWKMYKKDKDVKLREYFIIKYMLLFSLVAVRKDKKVVQNLK